MTRQNGQNSANVTDPNPMATTFDGNIRKGVQLFLDEHPDGILEQIRANNPMDRGRRPLVDKPEDLPEIRADFAIEEPAGTWVIRTKPNEAYGTWDTAYRVRKGFSASSYFVISDIKYKIADALSIAKDFGVSGQISEIRVAGPLSHGFLRFAPRYEIFFAKTKVVIDATNGNVIEIKPITSVTDSTGVESNQTMSDATISSVAVA